MEETEMWFCDMIMMCHLDVDPILDRESIIFIRMRIISECQYIIINII